MIPLLKFESPATSRSSSDLPQKGLTVSRVLSFVHDLLALLALLIAVSQLIMLPNVEKAVLAWFIPPSIAFVTLVVNRADAFLLTACRLFLNLVAIAVTIAELTIALPIPKAQFPGIPLLADRILVYYFVAYGLFLWIICPGYVLTYWLRHWLQEPKRVYATLFLLTAWSAWLGTMLALAIVLVVARQRLL